MQNSKTLKIGVIGLGKRFRLIEHVHQPKNNVLLAGVCDLNETCLQKCGKKYKDILLTKDYKELINMPNINAVFVLSPDFLHEQHSIAALNAGKAVYCEKPLAISVEGCDKILEAAMLSESRIYVGHNMRHMEFVIKMKELIDEGAIGEVKTGWCRHYISYGGDAYFKDWHAERNKTCSLLLQKGTHDIDVLHFLCDSYSRRVNALGNLTVYNEIKNRHSPTETGDPTWKMENWPPCSQKGMNPIIDVEDLSMMQMELDNGVLCSYQQCHYAPDAWRNYTIIGTKGRIENIGDYPGDCTIKLWNKRTHHTPDGDEQFKIGPAVGGHGGSDPSIINEFINFIREGAPTATSPIAARNSVAAAVAAVNSLRNGGSPMEVPPLKQELLNYFDNIDTQK